MRYLLFISVIKQLKTIFKKINLILLSKIIRQLLLYNNYFKFRVKSKFKKTYQIKAPIIQKVINLIQEMTNFLNKPYIFYQKYCKIINNSKKQNYYKKW